MSADKTRQSLLITVKQARICDLNMASDTEAKMGAHGKFYLYLTDRRR